MASLKLRSVAVGLRKLTPKKEDPLLIRWLKEGLLYCVVPLLFLGICAWLVDTLDTRTPEQKHNSQFDGLMLSEPCVKLDDAPVRIVLTWTSGGASFQAPRTYTFTGAQLTERTVFISRDQIQRAEQFGDHIFVPVPARRRVGYSPQIVDATVLVSIPKRLVPNDLNTGPPDQRR
jgi:hypothetical protein